MGTQHVGGGAAMPHGKGHSSPPLFGQCLLLPNCRQSQQQLSSSCLLCMVVFFVFGMNVCFYSVRFGFFGISHEIGYRKNVSDMTYFVSRKALAQSKTVPV